MIATFCFRSTVAVPVRWLHAVLCFGMVALLGGCEVAEIETQHGVRGGMARESVNGTAVLGSMFQSAGHSVITTRRISPRLQKYNVIVWAPDDFSGPNLEQRISLENWLATGNRTLIYIGRDFTAEPSYWESMAKRSSPVVALEMWRRRAAALTEFAESRAAYGSSEFARWFTRHGENTFGRVNTITADDPRWLHNINTSRLDLYLGTTLAPAVAADIPAQTGTVVGLRSRFNEDLAFYSVEEAARQRTLPTRTTVLLDTDRGPFVTRVKDQRWGGSRIYVVANGSFLLNLPLANTEHRKLAGKLIEACGAPTHVAFLETGPYDPVSFADDNEPGPTGLEVFTVWPLGLIVMHAFVVGIVVCFALFPIFGRARELPGDARGDFGRHIEALGTLLQRTGDEIYAREQLQQFLGSADSAREPSKSTQPPPDRGH